MPGFKFGRHRTVTGAFIGERECRPNAGSVMPQAYLSCGPSLTRIERPHCSRCVSRMMLARIGPGPMGFEHRRFECPKCNFVQNEADASDPIQSVYVGWLAGELRAPN